MARIQILVFHLSFGTCVAPGRSFDLTFFRSDVYKMNLNFIHSRIHSSPCSKHQGMLGTVPGADRA